MYDTDLTTIPFARGYVFTCDLDLKEEKFNKYWTWHVESEFKIGFDSRNSVCCSRDKNSFLLILGKITSLSENFNQIDKISSFLFSALKQSENLFYDALELCTGRFVCLYKVDGEADIQITADATAMKSIFYSEHHAGFAASHPSLLASTLGSNPSNDAHKFLEEAQPKKYNMSYLPGFATLWDGINLLPANCKLNLSRKKINRIFPQKHRYELTTEYVVRRSSDLFAKTLEIFSAKWRCVASITSGLDSRLTLAASKKCLQKIDHFCYVRNNEPVNYVDLIFANRLATQFGFDVMRIDFSYEKQPQTDLYRKYYEFQKSNNEFEHFYPLAFQYLISVQGYDVHLRSNIGEALRAYYHRNKIEKKLDKSEDVIETFVKIYNSETRAKAHAFSYQQFEKYFEFSELEANRNGFDLLTLFELEHGISVWQSGLLRESDVAFDTLCIYNCREIIRLFMSLKFEDWVGGVGMKECISNLWPELLDVPINPKLNEIPEVELKKYDLMPK